MWSYGFEYRFYDEGNYTIISGCAQSTAGLKPMRTGFYRLNVKENNVLKAYAYFDWRDMGLPVAYGCNTCTGNDLTVRYHAENEKLWFWNSPVNIANQYPDLILSNGQIITWAEWKCSGRVFTPFWSNGLVSAPPASYHPRIVWGPYQESGITVQQYKIYRKYGSSLFQPCTTLSANTFQFTDEYLYLSIPGGQAGTDVHYYVTAVYNTNNETSPTNTVTINVQGSSIEKKANSVSFFVTDYGLWQNYPNPFNPTTKISYSIKEDGLITLKVYDVLGNEVEILVNEVKPEGFYEVEFDAVALPSGIYFYKMQAGKFIKVNKMILMR